VRAAIGGTLGSHPARLGFARRARRRHGGRRISEGYRQGRIPSTASKPQRSCREKVFPRGHSPRGLAGVNRGGKSLIARSSSGIRRRGAGAGVALADAIIGTSCSIGARHRLSAIGAGEATGARPRRQARPQSSRVRSSPAPAAPALRQVLLHRNSAGHSPSAQGRAYREPV